MNPRQKVSVSLDLIDCELVKIALSYLADDANPPRIEEKFVPRARDRARKLIASIKEAEKA